MIILYVCTQAELWRWNKLRTGGMAPECQVYHKRLASGTPVTQVKGENYSTRMPLIRTRISFAILRTSLF